MEIIEERTFKIFKKIMVIFFLLLIMSYFVYHLLNGRYGVYAFLQHKKTLLDKQEEHMRVEKEYEIKKTKVSRLREDNLDIDLLDEELRKKLGYAKENEIVIYDKK